MKKYYIIIYKINIKLYLTTYECDTSVCRDFRSDSVIVIVEGAKQNIASTYISTSLYMDLLFLDLKTRSATCLGKVKAQHNIHTCPVTVQYKSLIIVLYLPYEHMTGENPYVFIILKFYIDRST